MISYCFSRLLCLGFFFAGFLWNYSYSQSHKGSVLYAHINNLRIAYQRSGNGPALVLLHGFTQDSRVWRTQIQTLSENFTVIAWDAPGAGMSSDPPENFSMNDWAFSLAALLDSVNIKKTHILGISWGGVLAQEFYHRYPQYVLSLILADTNPGWSSFGDSTAQARLSSCMNDALFTPRELAAKYLPGMFSDFASEKVKEELWEIISDFHPTGFRLMAKAIALADLSSLLSKINVPTLLLWGEADKRSPVQIGYKMKEKIPGAIIKIIPEAGHICNMENPDKFNKIVKEFYLSLSGKK
jgi:pimeloyl-ACP methyl ester carboxylesterase